MAIRIVDEKPDEKVVKRIVCQQCGVKLEYVPIDVMKRTGSDYDGGSYCEEYIFALNAKAK